MCMSVCFIRQTLPLFGRLESGERSESSSAYWRLSIPFTGKSSFAGLTLDSVFFFSAVLQKSFLFLWVISGLLRLTPRAYRFLLFWILFLDLQNERQVLKLTWENTKTVFSNSFIYGGKKRTIQSKLVLCGKVNAFSLATAAAIRCLWSVPVEHMIVLHQIYIHTLTRPLQNLPFIVLQVIRRPAAALQKDSWLLDILFQENWLFNQK